MFPIKCMHLETYGISFMDTYLKPGWWQFINKYLLNSYHVSGTVLGSGDIPGVIVVIPCWSNIAFN